MNFYDSSRLESRLADLKSEQDDEKKERKRSRELFHQYFLMKY